MHTTYTIYTIQGVSGYKESRFITILFYLTDMAHPNAGGETAFPKGFNGMLLKIDAL